jgi:hypothetical protein
MEYSFGIPLNNTNPEPEMSEVEALKLDNAQLTESLYKAYARIKELEGMKMCECGPDK